MNFKTTIADIATDTNMRPEKVRLMSTQRLKDIDDAEVAEFLDALYKSGNVLKRMLATIFNSVFSESKATFMFSRSIYADLLASDKNVKRNTVNSEEYRALWGFMVGNGYFSALKLSQKGVRAAAVLELTNEALLKEFDSRVAKSFRELQKTKCLAAFDTYLIKLQKTPRKNFTKIAVPSVLTN